MEQATTEEAIKTEGAVITKSITGNEVSTELPIESPIDEVRRLNRETKELFSQINATSMKFEQNLAEAALGGRGFAGRSVPKTQAEEDRDRAAAIVKAFYTR